MRNYSTHALNDPARYRSAYALIATPAERALRHELKTFADRTGLTEEERLRIAAKIRAARDAAFKYEAKHVD